MRFALHILLMTVLVACVGEPHDTGPDADPPAVWIPVADGAACAQLHGEMCTADPAQCIPSVNPDVPRPFCVTGDALGESINNLGDHDGDGLQVIDFVWYYRTDPEAP